MAENNVNENEKTVKLLEALHDKLDKMALAMERTGIKEYIDTVKSPWKVILYNFLGGIARGFGLAIGITLIAAVFVIILTRVLSGLITLPFVGQQIASLVEMVNQYLKEGQKLNLQ